MKKIIFLFASLVLLCGVASAQTPVQVGPYPQAASVYLCQFPETGFPCPVANRAIMYKDAGISIILPQPLNMPANTALVFYIAIGANYRVQVVGGNSTQFIAYGGGTGGGSGSVTAVSIGDTVPLFTCMVANPTTTPSITCTVSNAAQNSVLAGPTMGGAGAPFYQTAPVFSAANLTGFPTFNQNTTGTASNLSGTPALPNGVTATTQAPGDNTTKLATTAFVLANQASAGVTSFTGDGALYNNSASVGAVTATLATALTLRVWANCTGSTATPTYCLLTAAMIPTLNQNTSGTAANLSGTPALPNGTTATTQAAADNTTKIATDAFVIANASGCSVAGSNGDLQMKASAACAASHVNDNGTTVVSTEPINATSLSAGTAPVSIGSTGTGGFALSESTSTGYTPTAGEDYCRADSSLHAIKCSLNGAAELVTPMIAGDFGGTAASPTVTNGSHITNASIPSSGLVNTAVTPGSCGDATHSCSITANAEGQITALSNNTISGGGGSSATDCTDQLAVGAISGLNTTGHVYCLGAAGSYTSSAAITISANNVTVRGSNPAQVVQFTGTTAGFIVTGNNVKFIGPFTLDHNSQVNSGTGALIDFRGNDGLSDGQYLANTGGTNPTSGTIIITNGSRNHWQNATFVGTQTDACGGVQPGGSNTVTDSLIYNIQVPAFSPPSNLDCITDYDSGSYGGSIGTLIENNRVNITGSTGNGNEYNISGPASFSTTRAYRRKIINNYATVSASHYVNNLIKIFGCNFCTILGNHFDDGAQGVGQPAALYMGDLYDAVEANNDFKIDGGLSGAMNCADCARNTFTGDTVYGGGNNDPLYMISSSGAASDHNTITGLTGQLGQGGDCVRLDASAGSGSVNGTTIIGLNCQGTAHTGENGIRMTSAAGATINNTHITGGVLDTLSGTGITISAQATGTVIDPILMTAVTTLVSNSGTSGRLNTHFISGTGALVTGTPSALTVTLSGNDVYTGSTTYLCAVNDQSAVATGLLKITYASGTSFTITGGTAITDTVQYICSGY